MKKKSVALLLAILGIVAVCILFLYRSRKSESTLTPDHSASRSQSEAYREPIATEQGKSFVTVRDLAERIEIRKAQSSETCDLSIADEVSAGANGEGSEIPSLCLGEFESFLIQFKAQCVSEFTDSSCREEETIRKALAVLNHTNKHGLPEDASIDLLTLRLFALSFTGQDPSQIISEADKILTLDPTLSLVRDLKIISLFANGVPDGLDGDEKADLSAEITAMHDYGSANFDNAYTTEYLMKIMANDSPAALLEDMKARDPTNSGYPYYLEAAWHKKSGNAEAMFQSLEEALAREPDNLVYRTAKDALLKTSSPLDAQGVFKISLSHATLL